MRIKKILSQSRRDFIAEFICGHCEHTVEESGYDDAHFHSNVIPKMRCIKCKKTEGESYRPLTTKYPEGKQV
jgi:hypothetical protein